jgi:hypothetical protein
MFARIIALLVTLGFLTPIAPSSAALVDDFVTSEGVCTVAPGAGGLSAGGDLLRATLTATPQPLCNDGTLPIMYLRRGDAGGGAASPNWIIHTQGGGACTDFESCLERWCSPTQPLDAAKMSSAFAHDGIEGGGIFSQAPQFQNPFRSWNHVFLYYCSSDNWVGSSQGTVTLDEAAPAARNFEVHFEGHDILAAAIDELIAGAQPDNLSFTMPPLSDAERVIFSGDSAGSSGARQNADRVLEWITAVHPSPAQLDYRLLADAAMVPAPERLGADAWEETVRSLWDDVWMAKWSAVPDESCVISKGGIGSAEAWKCADANHVIVHHVGVPFFTRQDLGDPVKPKDSFEEFAGVVATQLLSWAAYPAISPPYATPSIESLSPSQGAFGPNCSVHVGIRNDEAFFGQTIEVPSHGPLAYVDVLTNWLAGTGPRIVVEEVDLDTQGFATFVGPSAGPDCNPRVLSPSVSALAPAAAVLLIILLGLTGLILQRRSAIARS